MNSNDESRVHGRSTPTVSLVSTILNEADQLPEFLDSISRQSLRPVEVVVVDGGSRDGSLEILESWSDRLPLRIINLPDANISAGRNAGIAASSGEIVAVTDAGVVLEGDWLMSIVTPFSQSLMPVDAVGGFFVPAPESAFEAALAATTLPDVDEIDPLSFLPSSRSFAFRRSWFEAGVTYPEWLDYCEDLVFDLRLKRAGARFAFQPRAIVHFRPRTNLQGFWRQYFRYARGDGKAGLFRKRHLIRYLTYFAVLPSFFLVRSWLWRIAVVVSGLAYMSRPLRRLTRRQENSIQSLFLLGVLSAGLRVVGDLAKLAGYPAGLYWRVRTHGLRGNWKSIPEREPSGED